MQGVSLWPGFPLRSGTGQRLWTKQTNRGKLLPFSSRKRGEWRTNVFVSLLTSFEPES